MSNSSPLAECKRHDRDGVEVLALVAIHHQRDVLEEAGEVLELVHRADQLLEVVEPAGGVGGAVLLPHLGVAGFVEHDFGQFGVRQRLFHRMRQRSKLSITVAQRAARLGLELVGLDHGARGFA